MTKSPFNAPRSSRGARGLLCFAIATTLPHAAEDTPKLVQQFLGKYCLECHDADVQKGDRAFDKFALPLKSVNELIDARDIIDQIDGDTVELHLADAAAPTLIRENDKSQALYVLMPMRV